MSEVIEIEMTKSCARDLTDRIKAAGDELAGMLVRAKNGKAWNALGYDSWKSYVKAEFQMSEQHSFRMLDFAKITTVIKDSPIGESVLPKVESQARPLTKLPADQQPHAWEKAVAIAGGGQPTAKQVESAVSEIKESSAPLEAVISKPDKPPAPSMGMTYANMAITQLNKIHANDTHREEAHKYVIRWIQDNH